MSASFNNQITWSFLPIFNQKANLFVQNVGRHIGKGDFDVMHYCSTCTLDIVLETILGTQMKIQEGENVDFMEALAEYVSYNFECKRSKTVFILNIKSFF